MVAALETVGGVFAVGAAETAEAPGEPRILRQKNVMIWTIGGQRLRCLLDSGSEVNMFHSSQVTALGLPLRRLLAPVVLKLGTEGSTGRLPFFARADFRSGGLVLADRTFFVGQPAGYDVILGLPFLDDAGILLGSRSVSAVLREPPSYPLPPLATLSPTDLEALGYTRESMTSGELLRFAQVASLADHGEVVEEEPYNPLLDILRTLLLRTSRNLRPGAARSASRGVQGRAGRRVGNGRSSPNLTSQSPYSFD